MKKRILCIVLIFAMVAATMTGCGKKDISPTDALDAASVTALPEVTALPSVTAVPTVTEVPVVTTVPDVTKKKKATSAKVIEERIQLENFIKIPQNHRSYAVDFTDEGDMYVVCAPDYGSGTLYKVSTDGVMSEICTIVSTFIGPAIDIDHDNNIYVGAGQQLQKVSEDGAVEVVADGFGRCFDVTEDSDNNLFVIDETFEKIYKISPKGEKEEYINFSPKTGLEFDLIGIEYNEFDDNLYVAYNECIYKYPVNSKDAVNQGELVYTATEGLFGIAINKDGNIYVDTKKNTIIELEYDTLNTHVYLTKGNTLFIGLAFGKGAFDENTLYVTTNQGICKFQKDKIVKAE